MILDQKSLPNFRLFLQPGQTKTKENSFSSIKLSEINGLPYQSTLKGGIFYRYLSCENSIKNRFYSRLRKSIRKLNKAIPGLFGKKYQKFNLNIIFKLSNVSEGKVIGKCRVEN